MYVNPLCKFFLIFFIFEDISVIYDSNLSKTTSAHSFRFDPELAHEKSARLLEIASQSKLLCKSLHFSTGLRARNGQSAVNCMGLNFPNRIGQAAGLDKDGKFPKISEALGFGHIEVGTVTPLPQSGNEKPRLFRLPEYSALINRMGFNNEGVNALVDRIESSYPKKSRKVPLGINIGKGKETPLEEALNDYVIGYHAVVSTADYITINVSSPNTPDLRKLQDTNYLDPFLKGFRNIRTPQAPGSSNPNPPCLVKISPDEPFSLIEKVVGLVVDYGFDGIIACNTSVVPPIEWKNRQIPKGGISGKPVDEKSTRIIKFISRLTEGKLTIIGSGGVHNTHSAQAKLDAGASLLQIYSSMIYHGPFWPASLAKRIPLANRW